MVGGWQLRYLADEKETLYKFPRNLTVKAGETCTVRFTRMSSFFVICSLNPGCFAGVVQRIAHDPRATPQPCHEGIDFLLRQQDSSLPFEQGKCECPSLLYVSISNFGNT